MPGATSRVRTLLGGSIVATESTPAGAVDDDTLIVALHGWGRDRHDLEAVTASSRSLLIDLPGHGASPAPDHAWGARDYARCLADALDDHGSDRVVVVGHSFGGRVGVCLAAQRPDLVSALAISGTPLLRSETSRRPVFAMRVAKRARAMRLISEERLDTVRYRYGSADYRAANGVMRQILVRVVNEDYRDELAAISAPMTMIWGVTDTAAPIATARAATQFISHLVDFVELPGGHFAICEHPSDAIAAIERLRVRGVQHP